MTEPIIHKNPLSFDYNSALDPWKKKEEIERKDMDPEALAEKFSDRLIQVIEEEMKRNKQPESRD